MRRAVNRTAALKRGQHEDRSHILHKKYTVYNTKPVAMRLALSHTSAGAFAQQQLLVARCTTAAPRSSQGAFTAVCTSSAPCRGRSSLSCAADARKRRSPPPQRTTNALDKRVFGAAVYSKVKHHVKATRCALIEGYFNSVTFLRDLGVEWKVANGRFVETHYPFLSYSTNMKEAVVRVTMYAIVDGRRRLVAGVEVVGKVHTDTYAVFKLKGLRKALEDMRVAKGHPLLLTGYFGEDGMLVVELEALETSAAAPAAAPTQVHVEAQEVGKPRRHAVPCSAAPDVVGHRGQWGDAGM